MTAKKSLSAKDMNSQPIVNLADPTNAQDAVSKNYSDTQSAADRSRANHTGTQLAATISDFNSAVRTGNSVAQLAAPTGALGMNSQKITSLADPTGAQDASTKNYVDAQISALSSGLVFKGAVRAATATNVSTTSAPSTIDGVTPTAGDVFLLTGQTTGSENGPWTWNSAGAAMVRPTNWDTTAEAVPGSLWVVRQGSFDNQLAILSNDSFTLGTTTGTFAFINPAAASDNDTSYTETSPATSAGGTWAVNHNLGTKILIIQVFRTASPFDDVDVSITRDTTNQINIHPDIALASGDFTVVVAKVV